MKIDNKGWGLNTLIICIIVIFIALIAATFYTIRLNKILGRNNNKTEQIIDNQAEINYYINKKINMTSAADKYIKDYDIELTTSPLRIDLDALVSNEYLNSIKDYRTENKCKGYVSAYLNDVNLKVLDSYLKCDNYVSDNYGGSK